MTDRMTRRGSAGGAPAGARRMSADAIIAELETADRETVTAIAMKAVQILGGLPTAPAARQPDLIVVKEAARLAGVGVQTIKSWGRKHGFAWSTASGRWLADREAVVAFLKTRL